MTDQLFTDFAVESNMIEGINHTTDKQIEALRHFCTLDGVCVSDVRGYVHQVQPGAVFRNETTIPGVRVGNHIAPPSGPAVGRNLEMLLDYAQKANADPWSIHCDYETLHPFTDGNGRSGRALWLRMMMRGTERQRRLCELGFLHAFYYQTLGGVR